MVKTKKNQEKPRKTNKNITPFLHRESYREFYLEKGLNRRTFDIHYEIHNLYDKKIHSNRITQTCW